MSPADMMRALARDLLDGSPDGRRLVIAAVDIETDPCGCARARVAHAAALSDPSDALAARLLLRREYDRRAGRPNCPFELELDLSRGSDL